MPRVSSPAKETPSPLEPYVKLLKPLTINAPKTQSKQSIEPIPIKKLNYINGIPRVMWNEEEVDRMIVIKELQYATIGKISYGWPKLEDLRI